jgi:glycosyltransferase involved in cell wall biosynthesis
MDRPLRVGLDLSVVAHALGGVSRYMTGLASGLLSLEETGEIELTLVDVPATHPGIPSPAGCDAILRNPLWAGIPLLRRLPLGWGWEPKSRMRRLSGMLGCDVYHCSGVQEVWPQGSLPVVTGYDTGALEHPEWFPAMTLEYARREMAMLGKGARLLAISEWSADRFAALGGIDRASIGVTGGAASDFFSPGIPDEAFLARAGLLRDAYVLHVGNFVPRKNIPFLLDAWRLSGSARAGLSLVLAGAGGWKRPDVSGDGIRVLEGVSDALLLSLYRGCRAVVLPSSFEGLGLPALEAIACGCALLSSDSSALPETVGNSGLLLPDGDLEAWTAALARIADDSFVGSLRTRALGTARRTWRSAAEAAAAFYRSIAQ